MGVHFVYLDEQKMQTTNIFIHKTLPIYVPQKKYFIIFLLVAFDKFHATYVLQNIDVCEFVAK